MNKDLHDEENLKMIHDQFAKFGGSIVLGFNDALVEITAALAGLTFALQNSKIIAISGLITGIAAAFSMAASEYQSLKAQGKKSKFVLRASIYTGVVYLGVVLLLVAPYLIFHQVYLSLIVTLCIAIVIVGGFSFYISIAQKKSFKKQFIETAALSLGIAAITFIFGIILRNLISIEV